jgi:hypothetical protein
LYGAVQGVAFSVLQAGGFVARGAWHEQFRAHPHEDGAIDIVMFQYAPSHLPSARAASAVCVHAGRPS